MKGHNFLTLQDITPNLTCVSGQIHYVKISEHLTKAKLNKGHNSVTINEIITEFKFDL